jgi:hypothetical protein
VKNKHVLAAALVVYLLVSFVPQIGLMNLIGKGKGKGKG